MGTTAPAPRPDSVENSAFFTCVTNSSSTSATLDLTTHAEGPRQYIDSSTSLLVGACARAIYVQDAGFGKLVLTRPDGRAQTITNLADGVWINGLVKKIRPASRYSAIIIYW